MRVSAGTGSWTAFRTRLLTAASCIALALLAGCGSSSNSSNPSGNSFQLTVQPSGSGTVTSSPAGINCGTNCSQTFSSGSKVTLTATPASNSYFSGWGGACSGIASCTVTLTANSMVTAKFAATPALSVQLSGTGSGSVTSTPSGINCGSTCTANFALGTQVSLTAAPAANSTFSGWSGAGCSGAGTCTFALTSDSSITATFASTTSQTLSVTDTGTSTGIVTSNPPGINCGQTCSSAFPSGSQITLTAQGSSGAVFAGWTGACTGVGSCVITLNSNSQVTATFNPNPINHIIFLAQENRSLDHYFGELRQYWADNGYPDQPFDGLPQFNRPSDPKHGPAPSNPGCNPADPFQPPSPGSTFHDCVFDTTTQVASFHLNTMCVENPSPSWNESHVAWDYYDPTGLQPAVLNGFVFSAAHDSREEYYFGNILQYDLNGNRVLGYYDGNDLNYYYFMASNFATSDRWFMPVMSRTNPNREYLIGATSYGYAYPNGTNANDMAQIPSAIIFQELQSGGVTWKVYVYPNPQPAQYGTLLCAANDIRPQCLYHVTYLQNFTYGQTIVDQYPQNIVPISQFYSDAQNGTLPQVAQIEPASAIGLDEHAADFDTSPACCSVQAGAAYVEGLIAAVMGTPSAPGPSWKDSVFILTYDEFGGFYDHVSPQPAVLPGDFAQPVDLFPGPPPNGPDICVDQTGPTCSFNYTGYRVPLLVVSPFTRKNYVSHTVADNTAILKLIEKRFGLPSLTARDAAQIDMNEFFDFSSAPWMTPPVPPAQNTGGACYLNQLP